MTTSGTGLGDKQRAMLGIVIYSLIGINAYIGTEAALGHLPIFLIAPFAMATIVAGVAKDILGIRDSTSAAIAVEVNSKSNNTRDTSESIGPK